MAKKKAEDKPPAPPPPRRRRGLAGKFDLLVAWAMRVARGKDLTTKDKASAASLAHLRTAMLTLLCHSLAPPARTCAAARAPARLLHFNNPLQLRR